MLSFTTENNTRNTTHTRDATAINGDGVADAVIIIVITGNTKNHLMNVMISAIVYRVRLNAILIISDRLSMSDYLLVVGF